MAATPFKATMSDASVPSPEALAAWAADVQPVFICGLERSGTSALLLALSRHPALFAVGDVFETFVFAKPRAAYADPAPPMLVQYLKGAANLKLLRAGVAAWTQAAQQQPSDDDLIRYFFWFCAHQVYPGRRPLEKTPVHVRALPRILKLFPRAKVLVCTRNPVDVVASYRSRLLREQARSDDRKQWGWLEQTPESLVQKFRQVAEVLRTARTSPGADAIFQVPYAWLTNAPEAALTRICEHLGLPFDAAMLQPKHKEGRRDPKLSTPLQSYAADPGAVLDAEVIDKVRNMTSRLTTEWADAGPFA